MWLCTKSPVRNLTQWSTRTFWSLFDAFSRSKSPVLHTKSVLKGYFLCKAPPMPLIDRIINIDNQGLGDSIIRGHKGLEQGLGHAIQLTGARRLVQAAHGGLTGEGLAHNRPPLTRRLKGRIASQAVTIIGIFIATGNLQDTLAYQRLIAMVGITRIASVIERLDETANDTDVEHRLAQAQHTAVARQDATVEITLKVVTGKSCKRQHDW